MEKIKILITGATGYIGRRLKNRLLVHLGILRTIHDCKWIAVLYSC
jgi:uncharacterized protein YbjT (DUF2867 family)